MRGFVDIVGEDEKSATIMDSFVNQNIGRD